MHASKVCTASVAKRRRQNEQLCKNQVMVLNQPAINEHPLLFPKLPHFPGSVYWRKQEILSPVRPQGLSVVAPQNAKFWPTKTP